MERFRNVYIKVHSLSPDTLTYTASGQVVDWESERGWFDQLIPILKKLAFDDGYEWALMENRQKTRLTDSYYESDFSEWRNVQQELSHCLSLVDYSGLDAQLPVISTIE